LWVTNPPDGGDIPRKHDDTWQERFVSVRIGGPMLLYIILAIIFIVLLFAYMRVRSRRLSR
jgi:hypothetical protein